MKAIDFIGLSSGSAADWKSAAGLRGSPPAPPPPLATPTPPNRTTPDPMSRQARTGFCDLTEPKGGANYGVH
jgi:hypothetical protein